MTVQKEEITSITEKLIHRRFYEYYSKPKKVTKHIILDRFFPSERKITSKISGLQTSIGKLWEELAKELASLNQFEIQENSILEQPEKTPPEIDAVIQQVKTKREKEGGELDNFKKQLNDVCSEKASPEIPFKKMTKGKGADCIFNKDNKIYIFDIKTVQVNANNGNSFNETLILWTAYYKYKFGVDARDIVPKLVFPYNSADEDNDNGWWDDYGDRVSPLTRKDVLVGNQFWQFITGNENALQAIITAINNLSKDAEFKKLYSKVFELETEAELKNFSHCVKKYRIKKTRNVEMSTNNEIVNGRIKLNWKHGDCDFKEHFGKLLDPEKYICPTCENIIPYEE